MMATRPTLRNFILTCWSGRIGEVEVGCWVDIGQKWSTAWEVTKNVRWFENPPCSLGCPANENDLLDEISSWAKAQVSFWSSLLVSLARNGKSLFHSPAAEYGS